MSTTLTLKNIPDGVYQRIKSSAVANRRSLNSEVLVCLEAAFHPAKAGAKERLERARSLRAGLPAVEYHQEDISAFKQQGRP